MLWNAGEMGGYAHDTCIFKMKEFTKNYEKN